MIVCDKCKKPVFYGESLNLDYIVKRELSPGQMYPADMRPFVDMKEKYDLCASCMQEVLKNIRAFINEGKFNGELEGGSNG
jgi:hypothetical protein